jgi:hypothetical protein
MDFNTEAQRFLLKMKTEEHRGFAWIHGTPDGVVWIILNDTGEASVFLRLHLQ